MTQSSSVNTKIVIMAGGLGTRISSVDNRVPKPMIDICGNPVLQYTIEALHNQGYNDIIIVTGYMKEVIENYFSDGGKFGVRIEYFREEVPLGTAGALYKIQDKLTDYFFLLNGDIIMDVDFNRMEEFHNKCDSPLATLFVHPNNHPYDSALISTDANGIINDWSNKEDDRGWYNNLVNAGIHILSKELFITNPMDAKVDLDRDVLKPLISSKRIYAYKSPEYVKDMGTPERYYRVVQDVKDGLVSRKNLSNKQKAVFLDRDGTINVYKGFITNSSQIELIPGVAEAIKKLNEIGYLTIVVTNQPVIARGESTFEELLEMHNKIETLLGNEGAYIDDLFFCPHHPDKGFEGERVEFKIDCDCRKPKPGMLLKAAEIYNIDLNNSYMVGDGINDIEAGLAAGCTPIYLSPDHKDDNDIVRNNNVRVYKDLLGFVTAEFMED